MTEVSLSVDKMQRRRVGQRPRTTREYLGLKREEVATALAIPLDAVTAMEDGEQIGDADLARLAAVYRLPAEHFRQEGASAAHPPDEVAHLPRKAATLSAQDRDELRRFAGYLQARAYGR